MTIGKIIYKIIYKPTLSFRYNLKHFGIIGWITYKIGESQMKKSAQLLKPITLSENFLLEVSYLTGSKYWHQTIFCAYSLSRVMDNRIKIKIYSDGTLEEKHCILIKNIFTNCEFILEEDVISLLDKYLPKNTYPTLRKLREWHPFFKRLIDIHATSNWALHLDSDMIFFSRPTEILEAYHKKSAIYMQERLHHSFYVTDEKELKKRFNISCSPKVNGGIVGYNNNLINYVDLEEKAKLILESYSSAGPAQVEQTLMSYILFSQQANSLNPDDYKIFYDQILKTNNSPILIHYIYKAKLPYFKDEWKKILL